jgi:2-polyprenyl-3-methyl-5-hydroxy-6-metoxy-1,4-benzoquinol methylase
LQKIIDDRFFEECRQIYDSYKLYHQGEGKEQRIFEQRSGVSRPRSELLIDHLYKFISDKPAGRLLDIGCGEGFFLATFTAHFPGWKVSGLDMGARYRDRILSLPGAEDYFDGDPTQARGPYDVITLNHTLEHIPHPADYLANLSSLLLPTGVLLVDVPDWTANPFDLVVADHCTHFDANSLAEALRRAGYLCRSLDHDVIPKEWLAVAHRGSGGADQTPSMLGLDATVKVLAWLKRFSDFARLERDEARGSFGIFGVANAGVWLDNVLDRQAEFFVDEDVGRLGQNFMERPVLHPSRVKPGATVFLAFPTSVARKLAARLAGLPIRLVVGND